MNICVFIKQVPEESRVKVKDNTLICEGIPQIINPADLNALEIALQIKDDIGGLVTVCTMGPLSAENLLRQTAAMGADKLCLISDSAFVGSDTLVTSKILAKAVQHLGGFDLILCGRKSIDFETGHVGTELAALLNIPCLTNCVTLRIDGSSIICRRILEAVYQEWRFRLPALITVYNSINSPRLPSISGIRYAANLPIELLTAKTLNIPLGHCGLLGSPTTVRNITAKPFKKRRVVRTNKEDGIKQVLMLIRDAKRDL